MLKSLQTGRAFAALAVASFHLSSIIPRENSFLSRISVHGNCGVDFFFVLSGFIIFFAHGRDINHPDRLPRYFSNRFLRVYPIYWVFTIIVIAGRLAGFGNAEFPHSAWDWISTASLLRFTSAETPLNVAWTLFYEIAFYLIFSTLILNRKFGIAVFIAWIAVILYDNHLSQTHSVAGVWSSRLCINFFLGMVACWIHERASVRVGWLLATAGVVGLIAAGLYVDRGLGEAFGSVIAISCALAIAGFAAVERTTPLSFGIFAAIGDSSYTLYLAHVHIEAPLMRLGVMKRLPPDLAFVVTLSLTVLVSYVLYRILERPLIRWLKANWGKAGLQNLPWRRRVALAEK